MRGSATGFNIPGTVINDALNDSDALPESCTSKESSILLNPCRSFNLGLIKANKIFCAIATKRKRHEKMEHVHEDVA